MSGRIPFQPDLTPTRAGSSGRDRRPHFWGKRIPRQLVFLAEFAESGGQTSTQGNLFYFHPPKELGLGTPAIRLQMAQEGEGLLLTLEADFWPKTFS